MSRYVDLYEPDSGPFQEGQSGPVPKVSVLEKADCIIIQEGNPVSWKKVGQRKICKNGKGTCFCFRCLLLWRPRVLTIYTNWQGGILEHEYNTMKFDVVEERTASMHILISWNGVLKWHRLKTQPSLPPTMLPKRNAQIIWFSNQNFPWKFRSVCRYCMLFWLPLFFFKDIDECKEGTSGCSQLCNDNDGSFTCDCSGGYRLQSDKKSCAGEYFDEIKLCGVNLSNDLH